MNPTPSTDPACEVVRAAVAWNAAWNRRQSGEYLAGTDSQCAYLETLLDVHCWKMNNAVEAYLAAKNLPDSAQHPTPNPG